MASQDLFDQFEEYGQLSEAEIVKLRAALQKDLLKKIDQGKKPFVAATLAGSLIDKYFKNVKDLVVEGFEKTLRNIQKELLEYDLKFTKSDLKNINDLKQTVLDQISVPSAKFKADLKTAMLKNIGKGLPKEEIIASLKDLYPAMDGQINTLVNTSLQVFYKDATYSEVSQNFDYFKYSGPLDKVTRDYCRAHVNKVYTKEEADVIQAEILTFYNCRHELIPISSAAYERG